MMKKNSLKLSDYDVILFNLDHTIVKYNFDSLVRSQYDFLVNYLITTKKYPHEYFGPILDSDIDFVCRGTFIDIAKGNFLKVDNMGQIIKVSNGSTELTHKEIVKAYGKKQIFRPVLNFMECNIKNYRNTSDPKLHCYTECSECAGVLIFAKIVNFVKTHKVKKKINLTLFWRDVEHGLSVMAKKDSEIYNLMPTHALKSDSKIVAWLAELRKNSTLMLLTVCDPTSADQRMKKAFNEKWIDLFDSVVYNDDRFLFFRGNSHFCDMDGRQVSVTGGQYTRGSIDALELQLWTTLQPKTPRILFVGGGSFHDFLAPRCEVLGLIEELSENPFFAERHKSDEPPSWLFSHFWGRFDGEDDLLSLWGRAIETNTKFCAPRLDYMAHHPSNYEFHPHWLMLAETHGMPARLKIKELQTGNTAIADPLIEEQHQTKIPKDRRKERTAKGTVKVPSDIEKRQTSGTAINPVEGGSKNP